MNTITTEKKPRGKAFDCAICGTIHAPIPYPEREKDAEGYLKPLKGAADIQWKEAQRWTYHKRFAVGTSAGQSAAYLLRLLSPGETVETILRHRSRSGMMRHISARAGGEDISGHVAAVLDWRRADDGGVKVSGCGMDTGFHLVHTLAQVLWPDGFDCIGKGREWGSGCPSNDHSNGDRVYTKHRHQSGGYALRQRWI